MTGDIVDKKTMVFSRLTDIEVASRVRMLLRTDLDHENVCVGARDRIMFLSQKVDRLKEFDSERKFILGRPNFWCGAIARKLRQLGHEIAEKAEVEQAYVINLMLNLYAEHGPAWRTELTQMLDRNPCQAAA